jgi:hypothetical protein
MQRSSGVHLDAVSRRVDADAKLIGNLADPRCASRELA